MLCAQLLQLKTESVALAPYLKSSPSRFWNLATRELIAPAFDQWRFIFAPASCAYKDTETVTQQPQTTPRDAYKLPRRVASVRNGGQTPWLSASKLCVERDAEWEGIARWLAVRVPAAANAHVLFALHNLQLYSREVKQFLTYARQCATALDQERVSSSPKLVVTCSSR